jgi:hypothetical protein
VFKPNYFVKGADALMKKKNQREKGQIDHLAL